MSCNFQIGSIIRKEPIQSIQATSALLIVISLIAFTVLFCMQRFAGLDISSLILFTPPAAVVGIGLLLILILALVKRSRAAPEYLILPRIKEELDSPLLIEWKSTLKEHLHPEVECAFEFQEPTLMSLESPNSASSCFLLMLEDFMDPDMGSLPRNALVSLSFLIQNLESFKDMECADTERLNVLIKRLTTTHQFAYWINQLHECSAEEYVGARKIIIQKIFETLRQEKSLLLESGYSASIGHTLTIEFNIEERDGILFVMGLVCNRGEGSEYQPSQIFQKERGVVLELKEIPLESLENSSFFDVLIDLKISKLEDTDFDVLKETNYSIEDVYDGLFSFWPDTFTSHHEETYSFQKGKSCSLKSFLPFLKKLLGFQDYECTKIYLILQACTLLMEQVSFEELNLDRIEDAFAYFNRYVLECKQKEALPKQLEDQFNVVSEDLAKRLAECKQEKNRSIRASLCDLSDPTCNGRNSTIALKPGMPFIEQKPLQEKEEIAQLPPFRKEHFSEYLALAHSFVKKKVKEKQLLEGQNVAFEVLLALPLPSDPFWDQHLLSDTEIRTLTALSAFLLKKLTGEKGQILISPNEATLYLKVLTITLVNCQKKGEIPADIISLYGDHLKTLLEEVALSYRCTHPRFAETFFDCLTVVNESFDTTKKNFLSTLKQYEDFAIAVDTKGFSSLKDLQSDPELKYLSQVFQAHPELYDLEWSAHVDRYFCLMDNIFALYYDDSESMAFGIHYDSTMNILFGEDKKTKLPLPQLGPAREWACMRKLHACFLISSFFIGEASNKDTVCYFYEYNERRSNDKKVQNDFYHKKFSMHHFYLDDVSLSTETLFAHMFNAFDFADWHLTTLTKLSSIQWAALPRVTQNQQLVHFASDVFNLTAVEIHDLLSIQTYDEWMIPQLIGFYTNHFALFKDPRFQTIFSMYLFALNKTCTQFILTDVLESRSYVKVHLFNFLEASLEKTKSLGWTHEYCFFLLNYARCIRFLAEIKKEKGLLNKKLDVLDKMLSTILREAQEVPDTSLKSQLSNAIGALTPYLDFSEAKIAVDFLKTTLREKEVHETSQESQLLHTLVALTPYLDFSEARDLVEYCKTAHTIIQEENYIYDFKREPQFRKDFDHGVILLQSEVPKGLLPRFIINHDDYLFIGNFPAQEVSPNLYEFRGKNNIHYRIQVEKDTLRTYRYFEWRRFSGWCEYQKKAPLEGDHPCADKGVLGKDTHFWSSIDRPLTLYSSLESPKIECAISKTTVHHPEKDLTLAEEYDAPLIKHISRIVPKKEILVWKNNQGECVRVEIQSFHLTFEKMDGKWLCKEHVHYFIDEQFCSPTLEPFKHYLVLRNHQGKRIALMPSWRVTPQKQQALERLIPTTEISNPYLFTYRLNKKGEIKPFAHADAMAYLIYIALLKQDYATTKRFIENAEHGSEWDDKACAWIQLLDDNVSISSRDVHPAAIALRIKARLLMLRLSTTKLTSNSIRELAKDYSLYTSLYKHTFGTRLTLKEERQCYKILNKNNALTTKNIQLITARKQSTRPYFREPELSVPSPSSYDDFSWLSSSIEEEMWAHWKDPVPTQLLTRPGSAMIHNFLYYYSIARHLKKDHPLHHELLGLLQAGRLTLDTKVGALIQVLISVVQSPRDFPTIDKLSERKEPLNKYLKDKYYSPIEGWSFEDKYIPMRLPPQQMRSPAPFEATQPVSLISVTAHRHEVREANFAKCFLRKRSLEEYEKERQEDLKILEKMEAFFKSRQNPDPCVQRAFARLLEGISEKKIELNLLPEDTSLYELAKLDGLDTTLHEMRVQFIDASESKLEAIYKIMHTYPGDLLLEERGRLLEKLTLQEMLVHFAKGNDRAFYLSNPSVTPEDLKTVKQLLTEYLILATDLNQVEKMLEAFEEIENCSDALEQKIAINAFVKVASAERAYKVDRAPHLLVFEYFGKVRLRHEQYDALYQLTESQDIEFEARTGFGKSKVLIPLWLFLTCQQDKLTMMAVPSSLFPSQCSHLRKVLGKAFDAYIVPILFNRAAANDLKYLRRINHKLKDAKDQNKFLLTNVHSLHGMTNLKLKETLHAGSSQEAEQQELIKLRKTIVEDLSCFFDESRECFNIRHRYDYAVGNPSPVNPKEYKTASTLYRLLFLESGLLDTYNFEFFPTFISKEKKTPVKEEYTKQLLPTFAAIVLNYFNPPKELRDALFQDLQGNYTPECEAFYKKLSPEKLEEYASMKKHLTMHMRKTLFRKCNDGYSLTESRLVIPSLDGSAKKQSEFSSVEDSVEFTIQANLKHPLTQEEVITYLDALKLKSLEEDYEDLPEFELFCKIQKALSLPSLLKLNEEYTIDIVSYLNKDLILKLEFIEKVILPRLKIYTHKIPSSSFNLIRSIHRILAACGTVNPDALPPRLKTEEKKSAVIDNLLALWKNSYKRIFTFPIGSAHKQLKALLTKRKKESVLIDVAGSFRDLTLMQQGKIILECRPALKGVVLFDEEGHEFVFERESGQCLPRQDSLLKKEELFIFIRKSKATGTDVTMPLMAEAIVTIDRDSYQDLVFQGTGRMRKLTEGQIVGYAVSQEDKAIIFGANKMRLPYLMDYAITVQGRAKGEDAFFVLRLYLEDLLDAAFWEACRHTQASHVFEALETFLVQETQQNSLNQLRTQQTEMPIKDAVLQLKNDLLEPIQAFCEKNPQWADLFNVKAIEEAFNAFVDYQKLPKQIMLGDLGDEISIVEADSVHEEVVIDEGVTDLSSDFDLENENVSDNSTDLPGISFNPADPLPWHGDYLALCQEKPNHTFLGIPVYESPNYRITAKDPKDNAKIRKPAYQYLIIKDRDRYKMVLLDLLDARIVFHKMEENAKDQKEDCYLYSEGRFICQNAKEPFDAPENTKISLNILRKLFRGNVPLSKEEKEYLKALPTKELIALKKHFKIN